MLYLCAYLIEIIVKCVLGDIQDSADCPARFADKKSPLIVQILDHLYFVGFCHDIYWLSHDRDRLASQVTQEVIYIVCKVFIYFDFFWRNYFAQRFLSHYHGGDVKIDVESAYALSVIILDTYCRRLKRFHLLGQGNI